MKKHAIIVLITAWFAALTACHTAPIPVPSADRIKDLTISQSDGGERETKTINDAQVIEDLLAFMNSLENDWHKCSWRDMNTAPLGIELNGQRILGRFRIYVGEDWIGESRVGEHYGEYQRRELSITERATLLHLLGLSES